MGHGCRRAYTHEEEFESLARLGGIKFRGRAMRAFLEVSHCASFNLELFRCDFATESFAG